MKQKEYTHRNPEFKAMVKRHLAECTGKSCQFYYYKGNKMLRDPEGKVKIFLAKVESVNGDQVELLIHQKARWPYSQVKPAKRKTYPVRRFLSKWNECFGFKIR